VIQVIHTRKSQPVDAVPPSMMRLHAQFRQVRNSDLQGRVRVETVRVLRASNISLVTSHTHTHTQASKQKVRPYQ